MRFYTNQPRFYCGIDRYARSLALCILNQEGDIVVWSKPSSSLAVSTTLKFFNGDEFMEGTGGGYENFLYLPFSTSPFPLLTKEGNLEDGFPLKTAGMTK